MFKVGMVTKWSALAEIYIDQELIKLYSKGREGQAFEE